MIIPDVKNHQVFDCPTSPDGVSGVYPVGLTLWSGDDRINFDGNYIFNYDGLTYGINSRLDALEEPTSTFAILDGGDMVCCGGSNTWERLLEELDMNLNCSSNQWTGGYNKSVAARHFKRTNVIYADGHVKNISWQELLTRKADRVPPWNINWDDCNPNCPPPDVGPGKCFDPARLP